MNDAPAPRRRMRSVGAILAGFLAIVILSTGTDMALHAAGVYPPWEQRMSDPLFALALAYRIVFGIAGCWLAARLAPDRPMGHALALAAIGTVLSAAGAAAMWKFGPAWYSIGVIAISLPCGWVGAKLHAAQLPARAGS